MSLEDAGNSLGSQIPLSATYLITAFFTISLYNVIELTIKIFLTFKRRTGVYFWSCLVATWGIAIYCIGFVLKDFGLANSISYFYVTLIVVGWWMMVTGQSMVLYSRLHLIMHNELLLRFVLGMIIVNAIIMHIPTTVLAYGANSTDYQRFLVPYSVFERVQVSIFFGQESIISGLYVYQTNRMFRPGGQMHGDVGRKLLLYLICISVVVALMDIIILGLEYAGKYTSQTAVKPVIYSIKLKLEFSILNRLVIFVQRVRDPTSISFDGSFYDMQQEEQSANEVHTRRRCWSLVLFVRKARNEIGIPEK
ncbi:integral membrane protein [Penicillium taxi]|uniref:uncharacterized protein n=1 Tax=Penicillium taxi TaxID=168475 RepID=UPI0025459B89|nr:uncharacterized protein N7495_004561 [Penicillium taxi]KAJ5899817.1 integral membrane protein [Penicillium taxi]